METVAIIGMGISGSAALLAYDKIMKENNTSFTLDLYDKEDSFAKGVPFREESQAALLNSRAAMISYDPDQPDDFKDWLQERHGHPVEYATRQEFGVYLGQRVDELIQSTQARVLKEWVEDLQWVPSRQQWAVLAQGKTLYYDRVHLCCGQYPSSDYYHLSHLSHYAREVYPLDRLPHLKDHQKLLVIGTGLSGIDTLKYALKYASPQATLYAFSRGGYFPSVRGQALNFQLDYLNLDHIQDLIDQQEGVFTAQNFEDLLDQELAPYDLSSQILLDEYLIPGPEGIRHSLADPETYGIIQHIFSIIAESLGILWQAMPEFERQAYLKKFGKFIDLNANPMPDVSARELLEAFDSGRLVQIYLDEITSTEEGHVFYLMKDGTTIESVDYVFNATGMDQKRRDLEALTDFQQQLWNRRYVTFDSAGGFSCLQETGQMVSPRYGTLDTLHGHGVLVSGSMYQNNGVRMIQNTAYRLMKEIYG